MPTPEALSLVHLIRHAVDMSDEECALEADRFAAQRGAPATHEGHNEPCYYCGAPCNGLAGDPSQWPIPLCHADDPGRVKWHHEGCVQMRLIEGAPPQTGGGDAGERDYLERAHAVLRDGHRRHLREPPGGKNLTLCEVDAIAGALRSSHREGAEAMREACAFITHDAISLLEADIRIRALPIPGSKTDAG